MHYKTKIIPLKCNNKDVFNLNKLSAKVWNLCVEIDKDYKKNNKKGMGRTELQKRTKKCVKGLSGKNIQFVVHKYLFARNSMWKSIKAKHENSNKVKLPYKNKKYYNTGWDKQAVKVKDNYLLLSRPILYVNGKKQNQKPFKCYCKNPPNNIVEVELICKQGKYYLAIKYKEEAEYLQIQSKNEASIDLGEIHSITSIDNNGNSIIITGRKLRSIKRLRNKHLAKLRSKRDKCTKGSRQYWKYHNAIQNLRRKIEFKILDCVHKITKHYVNYCLMNNISKVYYGDLDSCTRNTKERKGKFIGEKLNQWNYGELVRQLENKLTRYGIELVKVKEYYTSRKCPKCGDMNKPNSRNYICGLCGYEQHRDIVGAINILNDNSEYKIIKYKTKKYLQIN